MKGERRKCRVFENMKISELQSLAEQGDVKAQLMLGRRYYYKGYRVEKKLYKSCGMVCQGSRTG